MGQGAPLIGRRAALGALATLGSAGCTPPAEWEGGWVGAAHARGHRLLKSGALPPPAVQRRAAVIVAGAGIAGLSAARALVRSGVDDVQVLELEDAAGGNSRGHVLAGQRCPLGAHYLPLPGEAAREVAEWLHEIGLLRHELGRTVPDERHLCHAPQERLFIDGAWAEGLLPPAEGEATRQAYRRFAARVAEVQRLGFALPTQRAPWTAAHAELDGQTFAAWLDREGFADERLRWYLDYACRDDYGAGPGTVSAWAGLHYFCSRHGFAAPGDEAPHEPVFTWPEGNAWLAQRLAAPLGERLHTGRTVLAVAEGRHEVQVLAWDEAAQQLEAWTAGRVILALPLFVSARLLAQVPAALAEARARVPHAPWLVANLHLSAPPADRPGAPPSWDNVPYRAAGLGYVDAGHQRLDPRPAPVVLTAYHALPVAERAALRDGDWRGWTARVLADLATAHPDLPQRLRRAELMRHGHAMAVPVPGVRSLPALAALASHPGRVRFAHADLAGYSVFEEAFTIGHRQALRG